MSENSTADDEVGQAGGDEWFDPIVNRRCRVRRLRLEVLNDTGDSWKSGEGFGEVLFEAILASRVMCLSEAQPLDDIALEVSIGGAYSLQDGREFWLDTMAVMEIMRRIREAERTARQDVPNGETAK